MSKRPINLIVICLALLVSACISSKIPLQLGYEVQLLPDRALLQLTGAKNEEFYKFTFHDGKYTIIEKGDEDKPLPAAFHKIPGLPENYHVGWTFMGKGSIFEDNYYNIVWLEISPSGHQQIVLFASGDENEKIIAEEMEIDSNSRPKVKTADDMVRYAQILYKLRDKLNLGRFDIYDLANKSDYEKAKSLVGEAFLAE